MYFIKNDSTYFKIYSNQKVPILFVPYFGLKFLNKQKGMFHNTFYYFGIPTLYNILEYYVV